MTTNEILKSDLLDILFEHRNKSYGAYALRRNYNHRLMLALGIALSAVVLFYLLSFLKGNKNPDSFVTGISPDIITISQIEMPQKIELPPVARVQAAPAVNQIQDAGIRVVPDDQADHLVPDQTQIAAAAISTQTSEGTAPTDLAKAAPVATPAAVESKGTEPTTDLTPVEIEPSFPGGPAALAQFFSKTLSSPDGLEPGEKKIVLVRFVVGADGSISSAIVTQSAGESYDREVLHAFKRMPKWNPAVQNGHKISVSFTQPVTFIGQEQ